MWFSRKRVRELEATVAKQERKIIDVRRDLNDLGGQYNRMANRADDTRLCALIRIVPKDPSKRGMAQSNRDYNEIGTESVSKVLQAVMDRLDIVIEEVPEEPRKLVARDVDELLAELEE